MRRINDATILEQTIRREKNAIILFRTNKHNFGEKTLTQFKAQ